MCGRFMLATPRERLIVRFCLQQAPELTPRYNIAPSQYIAAVRQSQHQGRELAMLHWGLIPHWAKQPVSRHRMINARVETLVERPAFRSAFERRRCLIPADGYYEWQPTNGRKQPYLIRPKDGQPLAFAGLWERWENATQAVESCTIITTAANDFIRPLHDRMPLILPDRVYECWLDPAVHQPAILQPLLKPYDSAALDAYPVSARLNSPEIDDIECTAPLHPQPQLL